MCALLRASADAEKACGKIQHSFMIKTHRKLSIQSIYIYKTPTAHILLNGENSDTLKTGTKASMCAAPTLSDTRSSTHCKRTGEGKACRPRRKT